VASHFVTSPQTGKRHAYFMMDLDELPGWRATVRLDDLDGTPVATEIRLTAESVETHLDSQTTSSSLGLQSGSDLPESGLTATMLRKVAIDRLIKRGLAVIPVEILDRPWTNWLSVDRNRVGRAGRDDRYYAEWAAAYTQLLNTGENKPAIRLAKDKYLSVSQVRTILGEASRRGLLTQAPRGQAGGSLTPLAKSILTESRGGKEN
ncbi:uncharacterized protein METZ01_LOCUS183760, partial [marine metagenome]